MYASSNLIGYNLSCACMIWWDRSDIISMKATPTSKIIKELRYSHWSAMHAYAITISYTACTPVHISHITVHVHVYLHSTCTYTNVHVHLYMYMYTYTVHVHVHLHSTCTYTCTCTCIPVHIHRSCYCTFHVYLHSTCTYTCTCTSVHWSYYCTGVPVQ